MLDETTNIIVDITNNQVTINLEDLEYLITQALAHNDEIFVLLLEKLDEISESEYEKIGKG